ncbi:MAG: hypothetical protein ACTHOO_05725 [Alcanivorax sp.]
MANQFLALSLFLMLLSFFIVLNSVSNFERERAVPAVLNSLKLTFSSDERKIEHKPAPSPSEYEEQRSGDTIDAVEGVFNANIAGFEAKRNRLGTVLHVSLPMQRLENAVDAANFEEIDFNDEGESQSFLITLVTVLRSAERGDPYRIDIVMNIPEDPVAFSDAEPNLFMRSLKRVSHVAEELEQRGLPKKMISAGLQKGEVGNVDLYFYKYAPFSFPEDAMKKVLEQNAQGQDQQ